MGDVRNLNYCCVRIESNPVDVVEVCFAIPLGDSVDGIADVLAEIQFKEIQGHVAVFDHVMQQRDDLDVLRVIGQAFGHGDGVLNVARLAIVTELAPVRVEREAKC